CWVPRGCSPWTAPRPTPAVRRPALSSGRRCPSSEYPGRADEGTHAHADDHGDQHGHAQDRGEHSGTDADEAGGIRDVLAVEDRGRREDGTDEHDRGSVHPYRHAFGRVG